ncbi:hypothetical protein [Evansella cellulosilytica]|uniref:Uncharacterized protein n=1 Tax=Evansella cellulosilytica (strain ATCC 21833 / DSM 2522 / FERM P-1141 / JCM 9156 / N-4) TaxID=649639 RepID=E6TUC5_EVAC2|nr:hypothetical protein [Evansella cellulosilytica]ADU29681.1 hypothetical protein Bcell_1418 [Evansella cellulosilytica DSM 2522]
METKKMNKTFLGYIIGIVIAFFILSVVTNKFQFGMLLSSLIGAILGYLILYFMKIRKS